MVNAKVVVIPANMARGIVKMQRNGTTSPWTGLIRAIMLAVGSSRVLNLFESALLLLELRQWMLKITIGLI